MYALAEALKIPLPYAVGLMEMLWHFTGTNRPQGDIGSVPDAEIAMAVGWPKKPALLIDALCSDAVRFVEKDPEHRLIVHDWPDHAEYEVCRSLERSKKDFLPVYGKGTRDRRGSGAPMARDFLGNGAPSREAKATGLGSAGETQTTTPEKTSTRETLSDLHPKPPQVPDAGPVFERFIGAFIAAGAALGEQDLMDAARGNRDHAGFLQYSPEDQEQIAQSAQDQAITTEARFMGLPINFIGKGRWRRRAAVRVLPDPKTAKEQQDKSESVERLRENLIRRQQREHERAEWKATTA